MSFTCWCCDQKKEDWERVGPVSEIVREKVCDDCVTGSKLVQALVDEADAKQKTINQYRDTLKSAWEKAEPGTVVRGFLENECKRHFIKLETK